MRKQFKAWITQDGTNNPIIDLELNSIGNIDVTYNDVGGITVGSNALFTGRVKAKITLQNGANPNHSAGVNCVDSIPTAININTFISGVVADDVLQSAYLEIECGL